MTDPEGAGDAGGLWPDEALVRPTIEVHDQATGPPTRVITPPPNLFSHQLVRDERAGPETGPTGVLTIGTRVLLMGLHGDRCWVVDGAGRHVEISRSSLRPLPDQPREST